MSEKIGLVGLGLVGSALVERLAAAGFSMVGYDIDESKFENLGAIQVEQANSPLEVARKTRRIVLSLPDSDVVTEVVEGADGIIHGTRPDTVIIDTTTGDPMLTAELAGRLRNRGIAYIDATIGGSSQQVRAKEVIVMTGGEEEVVDSQRDLFDTFAFKVFLMGPNGKGAEAKLITNLVLGLNRLVLAEGLALGIRAGIEPEQLLELLRASTAYSQVMDVKGDKMITGDFAPQARLRQHLKDVRLILDMGERAQTDLPVSELHVKLLREAMAAGYGDEDNSAIMKMFL